MTLVISKNLTKCILPFQETSALTMACLLRNLTLPSD